MRVPALEPRQATLAKWALRLLSVAVILAVVSTSHAQIDRSEIATPAYAIASGHPSKAYVMVAGSTGSPTFQAPGFPMFAASLIAFWDRLAGPQGSSGALTFAADCTVALLVLAGGRLVRTRGGGFRNELIFLGAAAVSPFFRETLGSYFHPDDVLALGLLLLALCLAEEGNWVWAGLSLGVAIGSKQWALLGVPAVVLMAPDRPARTRLLLSGLGGAALIYVPFLVVSPGSAWPLLRGPSAVAGGFDPQTTLIGMLGHRARPVSLETVNHLARGLPLLTAVVMAGVYLVLVNRRWQRPFLSADQALALLVACFAARLMEDSIALSYYALPLVVLVLVIEIRQSRPPIFAVVSAFGLAMWYGAGKHTHNMGRWLGAELFSVAVLMIAAGTLVPLYYRLLARDAAEVAAAGGPEPAEASTR